MSVADRRAFEGRLDDDAELARRVDALREIGRALRDDAPDLEPAFYARLRGRFEEQRGRSVRRFRPLSWEVAGLATAAALLAAVFVPYVLDRGVPGIDAPVSLEPVASPAPAADAEAEVVAGEDRDSPERAAKTKADVGKEQVAEEQLAGAAGEAEGSEPAVPEGSFNEKLLKAGAGHRDAADRRRDRPAAPAERRENKKSSTESLGRLESVDESVELDDAAPMAQSRAAGLAAAPSGRALPDGVVPRGERREIVARAEWEELATRLPGLVGEFDPSARLILVGAGEQPIDCSGAAVVASSEAWEIRFYSPAPGTATAAGCLFVLPRDGRPVRLPARPVSP
jgi:hypothetical protein